MGDTVILPFLNEHWTNNRLYIREGDEDHGHENAHPPARTAVLKKEQHKGEISYSTTFYLIKPPIDQYLQKLITKNREINLAFKIIASNNLDQ